MIQVCNKSPEIVSQNISKGIELLHYDNTTLETFNAFGESKKDTFYHFITHAVSSFKLYI